MDKDKDKIGKRLGRGKYGIIYLVKKGNKRFALKKQQIDNKISVKDTSHSIWREIAFYDWINKLDESDKIFFTCLHKYKITQLTDDKSSIDILMDLKDGTLFKLLASGKLNIKQKYSITVQIIYILYLIHKSGYYHGDIHPKNFMYVKTQNKKKITLTLDGDKHIIYTHGYIISLIDYGMVMNDRFHLSNIDKIRLNHNKLVNHDLAMFTDSVLLSGSLISSIFKDKKLTIVPSFDIICKIYRKNKTLYHELKDMFMKKNKTNQSDNLWFTLFEKYEWDNIHVHRHMKIFFELIQLLRIHYKELYCTHYLEIDYIPNFIDNDDIEMIKLNGLKSQQTVIKDLIKKL